ncbi:MAG: glucose-6-phosphate dehydrogenase [Betaproteobacteria bacterium]
MTVASLFEQLAVGQTPAMAADPAAVVIFGGAGDLAHRKLLPALYNLFVDGFLPARFAVVGVGRKPMDDAAYRAFAKDGVERFSRRPPDTERWNGFAGALFFVSASLDDPRAFASLGARLDIIEHERGLPGNRLYYLAVPPTLFVPTVEQLQRAHFVTATDTRPFARLVVEKPIGHDLESARAIDDALAGVFDERQIFRIDHYLGKETVQNILVLRFANSIFEPLFNHRHVDHVQITVAEAEGVGTRAGYYDAAGALRDMVQNHMLQLLALIAMEPPWSLDAEVVRDEKTKVFRALRPMTPGRVDRQVVRAQYAAGFDMGAPVPGYGDEPGVAPHSTTETFVALQAFIDNWRWAGVPFFLRTGKRLPKRASEISVHLKPVPQILFNAEGQGALDPNVLSVRIQPDEGFAFGISSKIPGPRVRIYPVQMNFSYASTFGDSSPEAYEHLLLDVLAGDATLFVRRDAVEAAWTWLQPVLARWAEQGASALATYPAGDWGPKQADALIESTGRRWRPL